MVGIEIRFPMGLRGALAIGQDRPVGTGTGVNYRHKETVCAGGNQCQVW